MNHAFVGLVRIDADIGALSGTPVEYEWEDAALLSIGGYTMDRAVGQGVVQPFSVLDIMIGRIIAYDKNEGGAWVTVVLNDITYASLDVALYLLARRITIAPLGGIAVSCHLRTSMGEDSQKGINVSVCGRTDGHDCFCNVMTVISGGTPRRTGRVQPRPVLIWRDCPSLWYQPSDSVNIKDDMG